MNVLAYKTGQNFVYRQQWPHRALINYDARLEIVDALLTLIFKMAQGACCFFFSL